MRTKSIVTLLAFLSALFLSACSTVAVPPPEDKEAEQRTVAGKKIAVEGKISLDRNVYIVSDGSGSMGGGDCRGDKENNIAAAKWATKKFVETSVPTDVNLGLFAFDSRGISERVPIGKNNRQNILQEIDKLNSGGGTPLNESIAAGVDALRLQRAKQLGYGWFTLLVVTDGEAPTETGVAYASRFAIPIVTIGFCLDKTHPLAVHSISYRDARNPDELFVAFQEVLAESETFTK